MKKNIIIFLTFLIVLNFNSCESKRNKNLVKKVNDNYYIGVSILNNSSINSGTDRTLKRFTFKEMNELYHKLKYADFSKNELESMNANYPKNENGIIIPDLDNLIELSYVPEEFDGKNITWSGGNTYLIGYGISSKINNKKIKNIQFIFYGDNISAFQKAKNYYIKSNLEDFKNSKISCKNFSEKVIMKGSNKGKLFEYEDKDGNKAKAASWDFSYNGKNYYIQENYAYEFNYKKYSEELGFELNLDYPYRTDIYVEDINKNKYYYLGFRFLNVEITKDFITQFDFKKYEMQ